MVTGAFPASTPNNMRAYSATSQSATWRAQTMSTVAYDNPNGTGDPLENWNTLSDTSMALVTVGGVPSGDFWCATLGQYTTTEPRRGVFVCYYAAGGSAPGFGPWLRLDDGPGAPFSGGVVDKPWIITGSDDEVYIVWMRSGYRWARAIRTAGGAWSWSPLDPDESEFPIGTGHYCTHPAVLPSGEIVFTSWTNEFDGSTARFIMASDDAQGGLGGFDWLYASPGVRLELGPLFGLGTLADETAGGFTNQRAPQLLADPTSSSRLFLVSTARATSGTGSATYSDSNIYCWRLEKSAQGYWSIADSWMVNRYGQQGEDLNLPDASGAYPDSFCPGACVDSFGRVHLVYYENVLEYGLYTTRYDVRYALLASPSSPTAEFTTRSLRTDVLLQEPALDRALLPLNTQGQPDVARAPKEYCGIACHGGSGETILWAVYAGTSVDDTGEGDQSVLYVSKIRVNDP